jgi:renalase
MKKIPKIVILGAGMSAVACAENLSESFKVELYEKSKGFGGRLCSKRYHKTRFHLGAQFCTCTDPDFKKLLRKNNAKKFHGSIFNFFKKEDIDTHKYFVHPDGMQALVKESSKSLDLKPNERCIRVDAQNKVAYFESGLEVSYDILISSLPFPQAQDLLEFDQSLNINFDPCIAVGLIMNGNIKTKYSAYQSVNVDISWVASSKFFNAAIDETWVLQFSPETSKKMFDISDRELTDFASNQLNKLHDTKIISKDSYVFKWKYAQCNRLNNEQKFIALKNDVFAIGDWNISPRIESAFLSGKALAEFLVSNKK